VGILLTALTASAQQPLRYTVRAPHPASHFFEVELTVPPADGCPDFAYSVWTPGGYTLHPHAENVLDVHVSAPDGEKLAVTKTDLSTWRVSCDAGQGYTARIRVHALASKTPYSAHLAANLLFANGVTILPYLPGHQDIPSTLTVDPPGDWPLVCSLPPADQAHTFRAANWDSLADASFAASPGLTTRTFQIKQTTFTVAFTERPADAVDLDRVVNAHRKLAEAAGKAFGGIPFDRYLFLYKVGPKGSRGGLEHSFSTAMGIPASALTTTDAFLDQMGLAAHEFVHAWNVKRARPRQLQPYDYTKVTRTDLLWVAEGWTSYYGPLLLARSGVRTPEKLYRTLSRRLSWHRRNPNNRFQSLRQISLDSWLSWSVPFFSFRTYYIKGSLTGLDLDLLIRASSRGTHNLDDIMQTLMRDPKLQHGGYTEADLVFLAGRFAGRPMNAWFDANVDRPGYLDLEPALASVGLRLVADADVPQPASCTGIRLAGEDKDHDGATIRWAEPGSPGEDAGIGEGDRLLAVNGRTGTAKQLTQSLAKLPVGVAATLTVRRGDQVLELKLTPTTVKPLRRPVKIEENPDATPEQVKARRAWLWLDKK